VTYISEDILGHFYIMYRSKPVLASAEISFKNKSECMEYAMDSPKLLKITLFKV